MTTKQFVIFIQHDGSKENNFIPNSDDWQILPELNRFPEDIIVNKTANDSFYHSELYNILLERDVSDLYICGCATDFCVDSTVKSALTKDFKVTIVADGHTTADRPFINGETTINHYNWLWTNMTPTKYKLRVVKTKELIDNLC